MSAARTGIPSPKARRARLVLLIAVIGLLLLAIGARLAHLQIIRAPQLLGLALSQQEREIKLDPRRGPIVDRNGRELALSLDVDSVFADPECMEDPNAAAPRLARTLKLDTATVRKQLESDRHFVWIKRKIDPEERDRVAALDLSGVGFVRESRRYYPKRKLAAHVLGACGVDNQGLAGLEFSYDGSIKGRSGRIHFLRDGHGGRVLDRSRLEPTPGMGLRLTLDSVIQHIAERELETAMKKSGARGAAVVVMRPQDGEVLALASRPTFDPNSYSSAGAPLRRNRAVGDFYEPGSTFKVVTAAAALDTGRVRPDEVIWCQNGSIVVGRHRFREDRKKWGDLTFTQVLARSSNVGAIKVAQRLEPEEFIDAIRRFGFGERTGIDLPGESTGLLRDLPDWSGLSQASIAMGQEIGVTPLQIAAAFSAIANDGVWNRPRIVQALIGAGGRSAAPPRPDVLPRSRRAIASDTARRLRRMLESVVTDGTAHAAAVSGYSVAGKTGTAQKVDESGRYTRGKYVAWFAGFTPVDRPELVIVVMVDEPKGPRYHGGDIGAPAFSRIAIPTLQYLGIAPDHDGTLVFDRSMRAQLREGDARHAPASTRGDVARAVRRAEGRDRPVRASQTAGVAYAGLGPAASDDGATDVEVVAAGSMPDLIGKSLREVSETLAAAGLDCQTRRRGHRVTRQTPAPGAYLSADRKCTVTF